MKQHKRQGNIGEALAIDFLKQKSYQILETNFLNKLGEIDIIAKHNNVIVFVEVKHRTSLKFGAPRESVTASKQRNIRLVALSYLKMHKQLDSFCRFDVIEVIDGTIEHILNAF